MKMATGSGKTVVMAMLIAWQALNKLEDKHDRRFSDAFLIVAPGITIRDRLRVLLPQDPVELLPRAGPGAVGPRRAAGPGTHRDHELSRVPPAGTRGCRQAYEVHPHEGCVQPVHGDAGPDGPARVS